MQLQNSIRRVYSWTIDKAWEGKLNLVQLICCTRCHYKKNGIPSFGISSKVKDIDANQRLENV